MLARPLLIMSLVEKTTLVNFSYYSCSVHIMLFMFPTNLFVIVLSISTNCFVRVLSIPTIFEEVSMRVIAVCRVAEISRKQCVYSFYSLHFMILSLRNENKTS